MPVTSCTSDGKPGYKWGDTGKCYTYAAGDSDAAAEAKRKAFVQGVAAGETTKMAGEELEAARMLSDYHGIELTKDAGGDLIIAWFPFDGDGDVDDKFAEELQLPNGQSAEDLHLTLLRLGDPDDYDLDLVAAAVKLFTTQQWSTCEGVVSGLGRFVGEGDQDIIIALIDSPGIDGLRHSL